LENNKIVYLDFGSYNLSLKNTNGAATVIDGFTNMDDVPGDDMARLTKSVNEAKKDGDLIVFLSNKHSMMTTGDIPSEFKPDDVKDILCGTDDLSSLIEIFDMLDKENIVMSKFRIFSYKKEIRTTIMSRSEFITMLESLRFS
jgi:hypothetical protein